MKKLFILLICLGLWACSKTDDSLFYHAQVLAIEEDGLLVQTFDEDFQYDEIYLLISIQTKWENGSMDTIQIGDKILINVASQVMQSLPPQVNVMKIVCE